jgi:ribosome-binding factor A
MPGENRRPDRVAEAIREEVATFLRVGAKDPRLKGFVTVTAVEVTRDLRHANVFVSVRGSEPDTKETFEGLNSVAAHLRSRLGKSLGLRNAPEVHFKKDESVAHAGRIEELLAQVRTENAEHAVSKAADGAAETASDAMSDSASEPAPNHAPDAPSES